MLRLPLSALALVLALASPAVAGAAKKPLTVPKPRALPNCLGKPVVRPKRVTLTCADAGFTVSKLSWTGWGARFAAGVGTASVNDCTPTCVAGHFHSYPIVLVAKGSQRCPDGRRAYRRVVVAFVGASPYPKGSPTYWDFRCGPR